MPLKVPPIHAGYAEHHFSRAKAKSFTIICLETIFYISTDIFQCFGIGMKVVCSIECTEVD